MTLGHDVFSRILPQDMTFSSEHDLRTWPFPQEMILFSGHDHFFRIWPRDMTSPSGHDLRIWHFPQNMTLSPEHDLRTWPFLQDLTSGYDLFLRTWTFLQDMVFSSEHNPLLRAWPLGVNFSSEITSGHGEILQSCLTYVRIDLFHSSSLPWRKGPNLEISNHKQLRRMFLHQFCLLFCTVSAFNKILSKLNNLYFSPYFLQPSSFLFNKDNILHLLIVRKKGQADAEI